MRSRFPWFTVVALGWGCSEYNLGGKHTPNNGADDSSTEDTDTEQDTDPDAEYGDVTGRICAPDEAEWVVGADVWVELEDGEIISDVTDSDGYFTLEGLPVGIHTVQVTKGSFSTSFEVEIFADQLTTLAEEECLDDDVKIAVVSGAYDNIEALLDDMSIDYDLINGESGTNHVSFMRDPDRLAEYDIIFFDCGVNESWHSYDSEIGENLNEYVQNGGSIYASDWAYWVTEVSFPSMIKFYGNDTLYGSPQVGEAGTYTGEVVDDTLQAVLGDDEANLNFDLGVWVVPKTAGTNSETLVHGTITYFDWTSYAYGELDSPLMVRMESGEGTVLYTAFHNEAQVTSDMEDILQEMILSL